MKNFEPVLYQWLTNFGKLNNRIQRGSLTPKQDMVIEVALPGLAKEDLSINVCGDQISLSVTKKELIGFQKSYENFKDTYLVDQDYDLLKVDAKMVNGLLTLKIPLKERVADSSFQISVT